MQLNICTLDRPANHRPHSFMRCHVDIHDLHILAPEDDYQTRCTVSAGPASFVPLEAHVNHCVAGLAVSLAKYAVIALQPPVFLALVTLAKQEVTHG